MITRQTSQSAQIATADRRWQPWLKGQGRLSTSLLMLSILLVLLTACTNPLGAVTSSGVPAVSPTVLLPTATNPLPTPTPAPLQAAQARVLQLLAGMTLEQKLGQLIVVEYLGNNYLDSGLHYMITQQYVSGILYQYVNHNFSPPTNTVDGLSAFSQKLQADAKTGLLIGTDQEGGQVNRLQVFHGYLPSAAAMAATGKPQYAYDQGAQAAKWMAQLGINSDLAPVVDVHTVDPPILQDRMFGSTPQTVATYAGAYLNGLQANEVAGCLKHFPGLGAVTSDPHAGLPTINRSLANLKKIDLAPYQIMLSKNHPAMIMDTDVVMPAIDPDLPAELSPKAVEGILRGYLGYQGVVITDGLYMQGISTRWSLSQAAVLAIAAGNDLIEGPYSISQVATVLSALKQALKSGQISEARVDQSVARILLMKMQYGIVK
ncbi:MAG TPA: glycoside hydrolase family 3 N-terminal domain-containing protein [Ktedonobacteraceae bacterium]